MNRSMKEEEAAAYEVSFKSLDQKTEYVVVNGVIKIKTQNKPQ